MSKLFKLFGIPSSLYTAKARSYLRKQAIPFEEQGIWTDAYQQQALPQIGRTIMPVVICPDGTVVQDGADILRHCDHAGLSRYPLLPESPVLRSIAHLFELFGGEGLLRPAMHYRWNFDEANLGYIRSEFRCLCPPDMDDDAFEQVWAMASGQMRGATQFFGATADTGPAIEAAYAEFLNLFSAHLERFPYLLGSAPTVADYALMCPLYGHLYRDPYPGQLMRRQAPRVARWVERMNTAEENFCEYSAIASIDDKHLPDTLIALLQFIAEEYLPELSAHVAFANQWLDDQADLKTGSNGLDDPAQRFIGMAEFDWRGTRLSTLVMPYRFYLLQFLQQHFDETNDDARRGIECIYAQTGLEPVLTLRTRRPVERRNHLEVWGEATQ